VTTFLMIDKKDIQPDPQLDVYRGRSPCELRFLMESAITSAVQG